VAHSSTLPAISCTPKGLTHRGCTLAEVLWSTSPPDVPKSSHDIDVARAGVALPAVRVGSHFFPSHANCHSLVMQRRAPSALQARVASVHDFLFIGRSDADSTRSVSSMQKRLCARGPLHVAGFAYSAQRKNS